MSAFLGPLFVICVYWLLVKAMGKGLPFYAAALIFVPVATAWGMFMMYAFAHEWLIPGFTEWAVDFAAALAVFFVLDYLDGQDSDNASISWVFTLVIGAAILLLV